MLSYINCIFGYGHKILILQKRALHFMYSTKKNEHTIPLFMPLNFLCYKTLSELMHDVSTASAPINICNFFTKTTSVHAYNWGTQANTCMHTFYLSAHPKLKKSVACVAVMSVDIAQKAVTKLTEFHVLRHFLEYYCFSLIQPVKLTDSLGNKYIS